VSRQFGTSAKVSRALVRVEIIALLYKTNLRNYTSTAPTSADGHFGTSADMSGQFGTGAEMSWVQSVLGPKCLDTNLPTLLTLILGTAVNKAP